MRERTSVATDAAGRRVMAKVAGNAEEAVRLEREAELLDAARHPGVVELVGVEGHGVGAILLTAYVEGPALAHVGRLPLEESAGLLAALASTLADLHDLSLVHGAVSADHVIVGPGGRPVLCGFAYGGRVGGELSPAVDVFALGELARFLAPEPPAGHVLARVAQQATAGDVAARPTTRSLAESLQQEVPAARLPRGLDPRPAAHPRPPTTDPLAALRGAGSGRGRRGPGRPRAGVVVAAAAAVAVVGAAVLVAGSSRQPAPALVPDLAAPAAGADVPPAADSTEPGPTTTRVRPVPSTTTPAAAPSSSTTTSTPPMPRPTTTAVARPTDCPPSSAVLQADVDGDGCPDALRYADGVLEAAGAHWSVGQPGDQVATGDWGCQGTRTLALFRPSTGEVFRFDGWAGPGHDLTATAVARVPGGVALRAADVDRDGCHELVIERSTGPAEVIRIGRSQP